MHLSSSRFQAHRFVSPTCRVSHHTCISQIKAPIPTTIPFQFNSIQNIQNIFQVKPPSQSPANKQPDPNQLHKPPNISQPSQPQPHPPASLHSMPPATKGAAALSASLTALPMEHFLELPPLRCTWRTQQPGEPSEWMHGVSGLKNLVVQQMNFRCMFIPYHTCSRRISMNFPLG